MEEKQPRLDLEGKVCEDVSENPKAVERKKRQAELNASMEADQKSPWTRERVENELDRTAESEVRTSHDGRQFRERLVLHGADLSGLDLSGLDLTGVNLHGAKLVGANLSKCRLVGANLHGAVLTGAVLSEVNAVEANFCGACLCATKSDKTHFMAANLSESCYEGSEGIDVIEKPLTPAESSVAKRMQAEGFRANICTDEGKVRYVGSTLEKANISGMSTVCKRRSK